MTAEEVDKLTKLLRERFCLQDLIDMIAEVEGRVYDEAYWIGHADGNSEERAR